MQKRGMVEICSEMHLRQYLSFSKRKSLLSFVVCNPIMNLTQRASNKLERKKYIDLFLNSESSAKILLY